jgi:hypothetical protein
MTLQDMPVTLTLDLPACLATIKGIKSQQPRCERLQFTPWYGRTAFLAIDFSCSMPHTGQSAPMQASCASRALQHRSLLHGPLSNPETAKVDVGFSFAVQLKMISCMHTQATFAAAANEQLTESLPW